MIKQFLAKFVLVIEPLCFMRAKTAIFLLIASLAFTSCKTYEVVHYKSSDLDKLGKVSKYTVYIHAPKNTFIVTKPLISPTGVTGDISPIKDASAAAEIRNPGTPGLIKKHRHDLNVFTKTAIADTTVKVNLKKNEVSEYTLTVAHSKVHWDKIGEVVAGIFGLAISASLVALLVYWFTFTY